MPGCASNLQSVYPKKKTSDPAATGEAIHKLVDAEELPLRFVLGSTALPRTTDAYAERIATWEAVSNAAQGESNKYTATN